MKLIWGVYDSRRRCLMAGGPGVCVRSAVTAGKAKTQEKGKPPGKGLRCSQSDDRPWGKGSFADDEWEEELTIPTVEKVWAGIGSRGKARTQARANLAASTTQTGLHRQSTPTSG